MSVCSDAHVRHSSFRRRMMRRFGGFQEISLAIRIWIDVEDIFISAATGRTPTGIQRLSFELCRALHDNYGEAGDIRLVRHSPTRADFVKGPWKSLESLCGRFASGVRAPAWRGVVKSVLR